MNKLRCKTSTIPGTGFWKRHLPILRGALYRSLVTSDRGQCLAADTAELRLGNRADCRLYWGQKLRDTSRN